MNIWEIKLYAHIKVQEMKLAYNIQLTVNF